MKKSSPRAVGTSVSSRRPGKGEASRARNKASKPWRASIFAAVPHMAFGFMLLTSGALAQTEQSLPPPSKLKKLSVEQLMDIEVTSVSKRPEGLMEAPSAIQVI